MPVLAAPKSDATYRNAKPKDKEYTIADGGGLTMVVTPSGRKLWDFRYRINGARKKYAIKGGYETVSVAQARQEAARLRAMVARGEDPTENRRAGREALESEREAVRQEAEKRERTFRKLAEEWARVRLANKAPAYSRAALQRLERNIFPWLGEKPADEITAPELLTVIRRIEASGKGETAHRVLGLCSQIFRFGVATGQGGRDICADLRGALTPVKKEHHATILEPERFGQLLRDIDAYQGWYATKFALRILPLVFTRPGELRLAEWTEFDLDRAQWDIPAGRMKMRHPHIVSLSRQVLSMLQELREYSGRGRYLFPGPRQIEKPLSEVAMLNGLSRMGYSGKEQTAHGFRATARTHLDEYLRISPAVIEAQLAHKVPDVLGTAYNRTQHLEARREMMQTWANYLDGLKGRQITSSGDIA